MSTPAAIPTIPTTPDGRPERPVLVTAIAILDLVGAGLAGLLGVACVIGGIAGAANGDTEASWAVALGIAFLGVAALYGAAGIGMLMLKRWGWGLQLAGSILGLVLGCLGMIVNALIIAYLVQSSTRLAFSGRRVDELSDDERRRLASAPPGSQAAVVVAIVAVVLLVGIALTGMMAAIAVPNLLNAIQRGKQKRTMGDIRTVATAAESYAIDYNAYPAAETIDELAAVLQPTYTKVLPTRDGWNRPLDVAMRRDGYVVRSGGRDGAYDPADPWGYAEGSTTNFKDDIVFSSGRFVRWPDGAQQ
jgi:type II secretory pathway pseudopilin PulG